jgi:hypothetical protein
MITVIAFPPHYERICEVFPAVRESKNVIFTYGQIIYSPYNDYIDPALQFHEATHSLQQDTFGAEKWWEKYLEDNEFRLSQEVEAYHNQFNKYKKTEKDRNKIAKYLHSLAADLSSDIYGKIISYQEARKIICTTPKELIV